MRDTEDAITPSAWLDYHQNRAHMPASSLSIVSAELEAALSRVYALEEALKAVSEPDDAPLWLRIANQRRAIRGEAMWRRVYEKLYRESNSTEKDGQ